MAPDKLVPNDSRVQYKTADLPGGTYKYMLGEPDGTPIATMVLVHGFPDIGFGWRYQIPYFVSLGFRVVVPDMLGYGGTDRPQPLEKYTLKNMSTDIRKLAEIVCGGKIILGGHDWGGALVWRTAMWYPDLIQGVFSVCTPFHAPSKTYVALEDIIASGHLTHFGYQLQLKGPEIEERIQGPEKVRQFLNTLHGGKTSSGELAFSTKTGVLFNKLSDLKKTLLLSEQELDYYVEQYCSRGKPELRGPLNWYRTRQLNFEDEKPLAAQQPRFEMPALLVTATKDAALPPSLSAGMDKYFVRLARGEVDSSHWALSHAAEEVNKAVARWMSNEVLGGALKASL